MNDYMLFAPWTQEIDGKMLTVSGMVVEGILKKPCRIDKLCRIMRNKVYENEKLISEIEYRRDYIDFETGIVKEMFNSIGVAVSRIECGFTGIVVIQFEEEFSLPNLKSLFLVGSC